MQWIRVDPDPDPKRCLKGRCSSVFTFLQTIFIRLRPSLKEISCPVRRSRQGCNAVSKFVHIPTYIHKDMYIWKCIPCRIKMKSSAWIIPQSSTPPALQKMPYPPSPFLNKSPFQIDIKRLLIKLCQQPYVKSFQCYIYSNNIKRIIYVYLQRELISNIIILLLYEYITKKSPD